MIKFSFKKLPVDESGEAYASIEEFKTKLLSKLFVDSKIFQDEKLELNLAAAMAVVKNQPEVLEILQINENSLPAARGQKRTRKPKSVPVSESAATNKAA